MKRMDELEIVISDLQDISEILINNGYGRWAIAIGKAIALLKEQEAVEPYQRDAVWLCGNCEKEVVGWDDDIEGEEYRYPFCRQCGKPVLWEGR